MCTRSEINESRHTVASLSLFASPQEEVRQHPDWLRRQGEHDELHALKLVAGEGANGLRPTSLKCFPKRDAVEELVPLGTLLVHIHSPQGGWEDHRADAAEHNKLEEPVQGWAELGPLREHGQRRTGRAQDLLEGKLHPTDGRLLGIVVATRIACAEVLQAPLCTIFKSPVAVSNCQEVVPSLATYEVPPN